MRINEVERLVGITKRNIRFYEKEGLLSPGRSSENGYRDYSEADVETLKQVKLFRKLNLPLEEIRRLQAGTLNGGGRHEPAISSSWSGSGPIWPAWRPCARSWPTTGRCWTPWTPTATSGAWRSRNRRGPGS